MLVVAACADDNVIEEIRQIQGEGAPLQIQVPASARIGDSILITLVTYGDGCVSGGDTEISVAEDGAEITPYDRRRLGDVSCPALLVELGHDVTVTFDTAGPKLIRVNGRQTGARDGAPFDEVVQLSFSMTLE